MDAHAGFVGCQHVSTCSCLTQKCAKLPNGYSGSMYLPCRSRNLTSPARRIITSRRHRTLFLRPCHCVSQCMCDDAATSHTGPVPAARSHSSHPKHTMPSPRHTRAEPISSAAEDPTGTHLLILKAVGGVPARYSESKVTSNRKPVLFTSGRRRSHRVRHLKGTPWRLRLRERKAAATGSGGLHSGLRVAFAGHSPVIYDCAVVHFDRLRRCDGEV